MNDNLNLVEILKDCPEGTKLYSPALGEVEFVKIVDEDEYYPIRVIGENGNASFTSQGKLFNIQQGECLLFPSKEQRDWSKFKQLVKPKFKVGDKIVYSFGKHVGASGSYGIISEITDDKYIFTDCSYSFIRNQDSWELVPNKKPKFDPNTLKTFDRVLVRDGDGYTWQGKLFSHINNTSNIYKYATSGDFYEYCIPYNDDTKHLVGTRDEAPEYYRYWEE